MNICTKFQRSPIDRSNSHDRVVFHPYRQFSLNRAQPLEHPIGWQEITRVESISPAADLPSPALQAAIDTERIELRVGAEYCVELGFDGEVRGERVDFRPGLPLVVSW